MGYAFISYSSKNQQMADSFRTLFNKNGIRTWMAPGDIPFGATYTSTINRAIKDAGCFVLLLSESAQGSPWVLKETERAISTGKTIFTVLLDDVSMNDDFEFMLSTSQAVAIRKIDENDEKIKRLIKVVKTYTGEEVLTKSELQDTKIDKNTYFKENAVMKGSVLEHFKGREPTDVVIPEGVTVIGERAFAFYPKLKGVTIPSTVKRIEKYAFIKCPELQLITVSPNNPTYRSEGNCCIERDTNRLVFGCCESTIPDGVNVIGEDAFNGCKNLTAISIPSSVICIESTAFFECVNLEEISFSEGVAEIKTMAFCDCYSLTELRFPSSITKIADDAFYNCEGLESITVSADNSVYRSEGNCCIETNTNRLVLGCKNSSIPNGITIIGSGAFIGCKGLKEIIIPESVTEIGNSAFLNCEGLKLVIIPSGVTKIFISAFRGCSSVTDIYISDSVRYIEEGAFMECSRLKSIKVSSKNNVYYSKDDCCIRKKDNVLLFGCMNSIIPDGITEIAKWAFCGCSNLTYIYLPESITKIDDYAFNDCCDLEDVELPDSLVRIGENAFDGCGLESVLIPTSVEYIGAFAFFECYNLLSITIPDNVRFIGEMAFSCFDSVDGKRDIFCEASKKPGRWHRKWIDEDSEVHWKGDWHFDKHGFPVVNE